MKNARSVTRRAAIWGWGGIVMTTVSVVPLVAVIITVVFAIRYLARGGSHYNEPVLRRRGQKMRWRNASLVAR
jgi:putative membrane protein